MLEPEIAKYPNFLSESAKFILSDNYSQEFRINVAILYKNLIIDHWQNNQFRKQCREVILNGLVMNVANLPMISVLVTHPPHIYSLVKYHHHHHLQRPPAHLDQPAPRTHQLDGGFQRRRKRTRTLPPALLQTRRKLRRKHTAPQRNRPQPPRTRLQHLRAT